MFKELNEKLKQYIEAYSMINSPIANKYGGCWYIKSGSKIGNYTIIDSKGWDLIISAQINEFLLEVSNNGGYGIITSIMEGSHKGDENNTRSHKSGNKMDLGLGNCYNNKEEIIKQITPILLHPASIEVTLEAISIANDVITELKQSKQIKDRIDKGQLKLWNWGWKYSNQPHSDILINPEKLFIVPKKVDHN